MYAEMPKILRIFFSFIKLWRNLWRNSVTNLHGDTYPSQNCDGSERICHNLWRIVSESVTKLWRNPSQFPWPSHGQVHSPISYSGNCDGLSVTISVTKLLWRKSLSQFPSQTHCDGLNPSQFLRHKLLWRNFFPSQFVTDPSQLHLWRMKLRRTHFRHNFRHKLYFSVTISKNFRHNFRHKLQLFP